MPETAHCFFDTLKKSFGLNDFFFFIKSEDKLNDGNFNSQILRIWKKQFFYIFLLSIAWSLLVIIYFNYRNNELYMIEFYTRRDFVNDPS